MHYSFPICFWIENKLKLLQHNGNIVKNYTIGILRQRQETEYKIYIHSYMLNASSEEIYKSRPVPTKVPLMLRGAVQRHVQIRHQELMLQQPLALWIKVVQVSFTVAERYWCLQLVA